LQEEKKILQVRIPKKKKKKRAGRKKEKRKKEKEKRGQPSMSSPLIPSAQHAGGPVLQLLHARPACLAQAQV
ncbi:MAG: hypothetical protein J8272_01070, partial ['Prunus persica' phytoplasma PP2]|nr:hypothetical protein ['Prunus persica' phytoplasma PP2]